MMTITHNGVTKNVPAFTVYDVVYNPQQKSAERNGNGKLSRETLPDKWSINTAWEFGSPQEYYDWFNFLKGLTRDYFIVNFPAPTGNIEQAEMYIAPISATMLNFSRGSSGWWKNLKCSFVEV